ncbi:hypothetical protein IFM89_005625 [Coptis chinensis]|uniref:DUF4283 domain-containing protein n=1 Tax=Coptis chinensis TaxID=261450 RepID=A0A835LUZ7_9MAGN|nr:hypothetical protein IFM89_005625 [Coptis chinensis]
MDITTDRDLFFISFSASEDKQSVLEGSLSLARSLLLCHGHLKRKVKGTTSLLFQSGQNFQKFRKSYGLRKDYLSLKVLLEVLSTSMKKRLDFAKVCLTIPLNFEFPTSIKLKIRGKHVYVDVEYPWKPPSCTRCCRFGHQIAKCPATPTQVWVPRPSIIRVQNPSVAAPVTHSSTHAAINQNFPVPIVSEVVSSLNDAVVSRESPSTARASVSSPSSLNDAVVSRESPSTAMATVSSPSSPSLPRSSQALSGNNEDNPSSLGPFLATPHISQLLRTPTDGSARNCLPGNSPFSTLRNTGSLSFSRES